jgi:hypothetical protein
MAFKCVHCKTKIEDDSLKLPRSGAVCPKCNKDPTEGWSPYLPEVAKDGREAANDLYLRLLTRDFGVREAALFFLEDLLLEQRNELSIRMGPSPGIEQKCSVCAAAVPADEGFRIEIASRWRATSMIFALCPRHQNEGLWGRELDLHANHRNPFLIRGDWHYGPSEKKEQAG